MPIHIAVHHLPFTTDCSGFVTMMAKWGGAPDPNGLGYNGYGFTGTLLDNMPHIDRQHAKRGDLVVYGDGTGEHVVMLLRTSRITPTRRSRRTARRAGRAVTS